MNKRELEKFLKEHLNGLPLEQQEDILNKIVCKWLPAIREKFKDNLKMSYIRCPECKKYFSKRKKQETVWNKEKVKGVLVYSDYGYGDDDELADVTYAVKYYVCPLCGQKVEISRIPIKEENRRNRC